MNDWIYLEKRIIPTNHKYYNLQIGNYIKEFFSYFTFRLEWTRKQDHAGLNFEFSIWKFYIIFYTYDNRHWCNQCNNYMSDICHQENHE